MKRAVGLLVLAIVSLAAQALAFAQGAESNPIYDTSGANVVPGRYYQLSVAYNETAMSFAKDSNGMCQGYWQSRNSGAIQYARFCSNLDCTDTSNRDSMVIQLNCGYVQVVGSVLRMTIVKEDATWFDTVPSESQYGKGYKVHVRATSKYLNGSSPGAPIGITSTPDSATWVGLHPIGGNPATCQHAGGICSALMPDRMINDPVYTNTWKNAYLPTQCSFGWKASPLYLKKRLLGFMSFKQDNYWDNDRLATQIVDYDRFNGGDVSPTTVGNNRKAKWFSNRACFVSQSTPCSIPGLCGGGGGSWAGIVVVIFEWLNRGNNEGKYCAGTPPEDHMADCCTRAPNEDKAISPVYYFEQGGEVSVDNKSTWFPMYRVYAYRGGAKVYMRNECDGDDIYWGNKDASFVYFTNHSVRQGQVWIRHWGKDGSDRQQVEEVQDTYVTPRTPDKPETTPPMIDDTKALSIPPMPQAPVVASGPVPIWRSAGTGLDK